MGCPRLLLCVWPLRVEMAQSRCCGKLGWAPDLPSHSMGRWDDVRVRGAWPRRALLWFIAFGSGRVAQPTTQWSRDVESAPSPCLLGLLPSALYSHRPRFLPGLPRRTDTAPPSLFLGGEFRIKGQVVGSENWSMARGTGWTPGKDRPSCPPPSPPVRPAHDCLRRPHSCAKWENLWEKQSRTGQEPAKLILRWHFVLNSCWGWRFLIR